MRRRPPWADTSDTETDEEDQEEQELEAMDARERPGNSPVAGSFARVQVEDLEEKTDDDDEDPEEPADDESSDHKPFHHSQQRVRKQRQPQQQNHNDEGCQTSDLSAACLAIDWPALDRDAWSFCVALLQPGWQADALRLLAWQKRLRRRCRHRRLGCPFWRVLIYEVDVWLYIEIELFARMLASGTWQVWLLQSWQRQLRRRTRNFHFPTASSYRMVHHLNIGGPHCYCTASSSASSNVLLPEQQQRQQQQSRFNSEMFYNRAALLNQPWDFK